MIFPKKKTNQSALMIQLSGAGKVEAVLKGNERIYSRKDTKEIISMALTAKTAKDFEKLGEYFYQATKEQDSRAPEYAKQE